MGHCRLSRFIALIGVFLATLGVAGSAAAQTSDPIIDAAGFQANRPIFAQIPFETIDMVSGNLILSYTDCVLPGNAGFDLAFTRTYNGNTHQWHFGIANAPMVFTT